MDTGILDTSVRLNAIDGAEYGRDGVSWQDSSLFTGLVPNTPYTFYARLKGDANHNPSPASAAASITTKKLTLAGAAVTVSGTYTYNGTAQTPAVTVVKNGTTLTAETDYTVQYKRGNAVTTDLTSAGTVMVAVTGNGDYEGEAGTAFTIRQKALTVTGAVAQNRAYDGTNTATITGVTLERVVDGDAVSVNTTDWPDRRPRRHGRGGVCRRYPAPDPAYSEGGQRSGRADRHRHHPHRQLPGHDRRHQRAQRQ